jgi:hypothetical protein
MRYANERTQFLFTYEGITVFDRAKKVQECGDFS